MNSMYFSKEQIAVGKHISFINILIAQSYGAGDCYNDIHIIPSDLGSITVEWAQVPWSHEYGGNFKYIAEDQIIMTEKFLPDNSSIYVENDEEYRERLKEWFAKNDDYDKKDTFQNGFIKLME